VLQLGLFLFRAPQTQDHVGYDEGNPLQLPLFEFRQRVKRIGFLLLQ
jgi:hypothetical protein